MSLSASSRHWITALSVGLASFAFSLPAATAAPAAGPGADGPTVAQVRDPEAPTADDGTERPTDEDLAPRDRAARIEAEKLEKPFGDAPEEMTSTEDREGERIQRALQRRQAAKGATARQGVTGTSSISGMVTDAAGVGLADVWVGVFREEEQEGDEGTHWEWVPGSNTRADGTFTVDGLEAGNYRLEFAPPEPYVSEYYDDTVHFGEATTITVGASQTRKGIDAELALGATVEGVVTGPAGEDLSDVWVALLEWDEEEEYWSSTYSASVAEDGTYRLTGALAGTYRVEFSTWGTGLVRQYYDGVEDIDDATPLTLRPGQVRSGINADLVRAATIEGRVQVPAAVSPEDVNVGAYRESDGEWEWAGSATPESDGSYQVQVEGAGTFRVAFAGPDGVMTEYYDDVELFDDATELTVGRGDRITGIDATLEQGASIAGVVSGPAGPVEGVTATAYLVTGEGDDLDWDWSESAQSRADGSYTIMGLAAGRYRVRFTDDAGRFLSEYYDDVRHIGDARDLTLGRGGSVTGINARLAVAGQIKGRVTSPDHHEDIEVLAHRFYEDEDGSYWEEEAYTYLDEDGTYTLGGLESGQYRVEFYSYGESVGEFYDDVATLAEARTLSVTVGSVVSGINATLKLGGMVTGQVTFPAGTDTEQLAVRLYQWDASDPQDPYWRRTKIAWVDEDGSYRARGLRAGTYRVNFYDYLDELEPTWFRDSSTVEAAQDVVVTLGRETPGVNGTLKPWSSLSGVVAGPAGVDVGGVQVRVWEHDATRDEDGWWDYVGAATTEEDGTFRVKGLAAGTYAVEFRSNGQLAGEWYEDAPDRARATPVQVAAHTAVSGIRATLGLGSTIRGRVTSRSGPVDEVYVSVLEELRTADYTEWEVVSSAYVEEDGSYQVGGLPAGTYKVSFDDDAGDLLSEYYDDAPTLDEATDVVVASSATVSGINADLVRASTISGTVRGTFDHEGVEAVALRLVAGEWEWAWSTTLRPDGSYTIGRLPAGTYRVWFRDWESGNVAKYYGDVLDVESAKDVVVAAEQAVTGIDTTLVPGGSIKGSVTVPTGVDAGEATVTAYRKVGAEWRPAAYGDVRRDGTYEVPGLAAGTYRLGFAHRDDAIPSEFYDDVATVEKAKDIVVADRAVVTGINAALGTVPPPDPKPEDPKPAPKLVKLVKAPKLAGTTKVGKTLKVSKGTWKPGKVTIKYQWFVKKGKKWVVVKKATKPSLKLTRTFKGKQVRVRLTVSAKGHRSYVFTSKASAKIKK